MRRGAAQVGNCPDLGGEWTHWWIEGDGGLLEVVPGDELVAALRVIRDNQERFDSIHVHRARMDSDGQPFRRRPSKYRTELEANWEKNESRASTVGTAI